MVPLSEIKFTRCYRPFTIYGEEVGELRYDVLLKSGPQFIVSKKEFDEINELIKYEVEDVYGMPFGGFNDINRDFDDLMRLMNVRHTLPSNYAIPKLPEWKGFKPFYGDVMMEKVEEEKEEHEDEASSDPDSSEKSESVPQFRHRSDWL